ncbi:MAG: hypothetical protein COB83_00510 [Gammaproteobacteria bacterium]|nr:MAG: hypothetical protein COB83_00510 [Gammaproteobacteria bacterium]
MSINQRQFKQLTEMGISLWQQKSATDSKHSSSEQNEPQKNAYTKLDEQSLAELIKQTLFTDILQCLGLSIGEVIAKNDHLDLGLFNWYFSSTAQNENSIRCTNNNLISPTLALIGQSVPLKKQLWQAIISNQL